jgi:hypothetical protein
LGRKIRKKGQAKRIVVKKVKVQGEGEDSQPTKSGKVVRKVVPQGPRNDARRVGKVKSVAKGSNAQGAPVVRKTMVRRPANEDAPQRVERVVLREAAPSSIPSSPEKLESGYNYLIEEPQPKRSFEFFKTKVSQGAKGLCISTSYPKKIIEEYGLHGTTVYWLSELEFDNQSLHPRRLDFEVTRAIQNFVKSNPSSVLIIDGVEFLILINGFERVMTFIKKMNDIMSATASTLITSINPSAFSEEKLSIIEREFDRVLKFIN